MTEDPFDESIRKLGDSYNTPPDTPRDDMWAVIREAVDLRGDTSVISLDRAREDGRISGFGPVARRWGAWIAAAAALVVLGIGIGRMSVDSDITPQTTGDPKAAVAPEAEAGPAPVGEGRSARGSDAFRFAAVEHLLRSESLLTMVRTDARSGRFDDVVGGWAGELLMETRLLMDSPAADDATIRDLLEDLELILVQLARLDAGRTETGTRSEQELELITRGMDQQDMLLRIQAMAPAGLVGA